MLFCGTKSWWKMDGAWNTKRTHSKNNMPSHEQGRTFELQTAKGETDPGSAQSGLQSEFWEVFGGSFPPGLLLIRAAGSQPCAAGQHNIMFVLHRLFHNADCSKCIFHQTQFSTEVWLGEIARTWACLEKNKLKIKRSWAKAWPVTIKDFRRAWSWGWL